MYCGLPLVTQRLFIRELTPDDLEPFYAMHTDSEVMRYLGNGDLWTREYAEMVLPNIIANSKSHPLDFVAVRHRGTGDFLGMVCLLNMPRPHREAIGGGPYVEIGWRFVRQHWNNGYATEAAGAVLEYGFGTLQFPRIVSIVDARNAPSLRVCAKLGLERVKTYRMETREIWFHTLDRQETRSAAAPA